MRRRFGHVGRPFQVSADPFVYFSFSFDNRSLDLAAIELLD
jgi:hypothetical protein